jgi:hypothetical protein
VNRKSKGNPQPQILASRARPRGFGAWPKREQFSISKISIILKFVKGIEREAASRFNPGLPKRRVRG